MTRPSITRLVTCLMLVFGAAATCAQSSDALLNKLVEKGVLTTKEAEDLRKETNNEVKKDWIRGAGMPDWITSVRLYGDFRGRYEQNAADNDAWTDRDRYRYRARVGVTATLLENFELGLRLSSGNPVSNPGGTLVGGSPVTANQDMGSLESRNFLWIDAAYAKWSPIKNDEWTLTATIGKMDNPFMLSNMIWDYDITPEGAALQLSHKFNDKQEMRVIGAGYVLDELNQGNPTGATLPTGVGVSPSHDPYVYGGQVVLLSKWTKQFDTSFSVATLAIDSKDSLSAKAQPFYNAGNTRDTNGFLVNGYVPIIGAAWATYTLDRFPFYAGAFPIKVGGEFMHNIDASGNDDGWRAGVTFGKAGKRHTWEINYRYQRLEADAWFDALVDDDNGAYYAKGNPQLNGTGRTSGWFGGTNVKGHLATATYSFTDFMNFSLIFYKTEAIIDAPNEKSDATHFMADVNLKF